jgi:hypothetical protein
MLKIVTIGAVALFAASSGALAQNAARGGDCPDEIAFLQDQKKKNITAAERQKVRVRVFQALDANKDGMISRDEYVMCLTDTKAFKKTDQGGAARTGK